MVAVVAAAGGLTWTGEAFAPGLGWSANGALFGASSRARGSADDWDEERIEGGDEETGVTSVAGGGERCVVVLSLWDGTELEPAVVCARA
jgi:hypothetical protein